MPSSLFPSAVCSHLSKLLEITNCINWSVNVHVTQPALQGCTGIENTSLNICWCSNSFQLTGACKHLCKKKSTALCRGSDHFSVLGHVPFRKYGWKEEQPSWRKELRELPSHQREQRRICLNLWLLQIGEEVHELMGFCFWNFAGSKRHKLWKLVTARKLWVELIITCKVVSGGGLYYNTNTDKRQQQYMTASVLLLGVLWASLLLPN